MRSACRIIGCSSGPREIAHRTAASKCVYSEPLMTFVSLFDIPLRRILRALALLVCLAGLFGAQLALAADQVVDLSSLGTQLAEADGCAPDAVVDRNSDERGEPSTHCQSCCFHHNGQTGAAGTHFAHDTAPDDGRLAFGYAQRLRSAALSTEKDPPRA